MFSDCPPSSPLPFSFPPNPPPPFDAYHAAGTIYFPLSEKAYRKVKHVGLDIKGKWKKRDSILEPELRFWSSKEPAKGYYLWHGKMESRKLKTRGRNLKREKTMDDLERDLGSPKNA